MLVGFFACCVLPLTPVAVVLCWPDSCGDVAWEAQVSSSKLAELGLEWDEAQQCVMSRSSNNTAGRHGTAAGAPAGAEDDDHADYSGLSGTTAPVNSTAGPDKVVRGGWSHLSRPLIGLSCCLLFPDVVSYQVPHVLQLQSAAALLYGPADYLVFACLSQPPLLPLSLLLPPGVH